MGCAVPEDRIVHHDYIGHLSALALSRALHSGITPHHVCDEVVYVGEEVGCWWWGVIRAVAEKRWAARREERERDLNLCACMTREWGEDTEAWMA